MYTSTQKLSILALYFALKLWGPSAKYCLNFCIAFVQDAGVTVLGTVPSLVKAWKSTMCMEGLDWTKIRLCLFAFYRNTLASYSTKRTYKCTFADPMPQLGKSPMLMMTYGFLQELITHLLSSVVVEQNLRRLTSKEIHSNHKFLELSAQHHWQVALSSLMSMGYLM